MQQKYTMMQKLLIQKTTRETNRKIGESLGLTKKQVKELMSRENDENV